MNIELGSRYDLMNSNGQYDIELYPNEFVSARYDLDIKIEIIDEK